MVLNLVLVLAKTGHAIDMCKRACVDEHVRICRRAKATVATIA